MGGDFDVIKNMINDGELSSADIKFFLGYSGWSSDQLKEEVKRNTWIVLDDDDDKRANISSSNDNFLEVQNDSAGGHYAIWANSVIHT